MRKLLLLILCLIGMNIFSATVDDKTNDKEKIKSIDNERSDTLKYGIDSEVKELIATLTKDEISGYDDELTEVLENAFDESIKVSILEYFILMDIPNGESDTIKIYDAIEYEDEYDNLYASTAIKYLSKIKSKEAIKRVPDILENESSTILVAALKLIGENKLIKLEDKLLEMLDDDGTDDNIYLEVIKTLGKIKSSKALEQLIPIADDTDEETTVRNAVCFSLGEIADPEAIPVLKRCLGDQKNYLLRKSALEALGKFAGPEMDDILITSLKDNNWQIRFAACKSLAERKVVKAFHILKYKALNDPEQKIKKQAFITIGDINSNECREFLKEVYTEKSYKDIEKVIAIDKLIEHNVDWIFPTIEEFYNEKNKEKRKPILDATLKFLSKREYKYATDLYKKMLDHENYIYKIYAIQGIRLNNYSEHKEQIQALYDTDKNKNVKKHALSAIEEL
ncbi:MAG: HEAT repeat domain-containing protein [Spirochaetaceae bacterium]